MKRCAKCGNHNADEMSFCLECGNQLAAAPFVVNLQNNTAPNQSNVQTDNLGSSGYNQTVPPVYPANRPRSKSRTKMFLAVGGIVALLLLLLTGIAAIVVYNMVNNGAVNTPPPTPSASPTPDISQTKKSPVPDKSPDSSPIARETPEKSSKTPTIKDDPSITVKFDGIDVDYNVEENGEQGMRMRVNFTVTGMQGKDGYLAIHFQKLDDTPLKANPGQYRDVNGNLAAFQTIRPDYEETVYNDLEIFLPYSEINLPLGSHDLKMDVDLLDAKGIAIEHLAYENFWYEQK